MRLHKPLRLLFLNKTGLDVYNLHLDPELSQNTQIENDADVWKILKSWIICKDELHKFSNESESS